MNASIHLSLNPPSSSTFSSSNRNSVVTLKLEDNQNSSTSHLLFVSQHFPTMYQRKTVRFADAEDENCSTSTPSPTYSTSTLSSCGPPTPPPTTFVPLSPSGSSTSSSSRRQHKGPVAIHTVLGYNLTPAFKFDVSCDPGQSLASVPELTPHVLGQPATSPPLSELVILNRHLPWRLSIQASSTKLDAFVTVADVLGGIYRALRLPVTSIEHSRESSSRQADITQTFHQRCDRSAGGIQEKTKGLKRVDFLTGNNRFLGLSKTDEGPNVWKLSLAP